MGAGSIRERILGPKVDAEKHEDGSSTQKWDNGTATTYNPDGSVREYTEYDSGGFLWQQPQTVTRDGEHKVINVQPGHGAKKEV